MFKSKVYPGVIHRGRDGLRKGKGERTDDGVIRMTSQCGEDWFINPFIGDSGSKE